MILIRKAIGMAFMLDWRYQMMPVTLEELLKRNQLEKGFSLFSIHRKF